MQKSERQKQADFLKQLLAAGESEEHWQLQARIAKIQEGLDGQKIEGSSGGGMVKATVDGKGQVRRISIDPSCVDPKDVEMLEDIIIAALKQAQTKARDVYEEEMRKATGGLPVQLPGLI